MPTPTLKLNLGSSSYITTAGGYATEHLQYTCAELAERMAYGEDFIHQQNTSNYYTPYTFSAKEKDAETGFSYFGARYYADNLSIWLSVDPLADKFPHQSPFMYCSGKPIMRVDPTGMSDEDFPPPNFEGLHWKDADGSFDRNAPNETYKWTKPDGSPGGAHSSDFNISSTKIDKAAQGNGGYDGNFILGKTWTEYMSGRTDALTVNVSSLNFNHVSQSDISKNGNINLANPKIFGLYAFTGTALALGNVNLIPQGNNMYKIKDNIYDFDIRQGEGLSYRNIATGIAGILHGSVYDNSRLLPPLAIPMYQPGFNIQFQGTIYIKP